jgi:hypothetical protein
MMMKSTVIAKNTISSQQRLLLLLVSFLFFFVAVEAFYPAVVVGKAHGKTVTSPSNIVVVLASSHSPQDPCWQDLYDEDCAMETLFSANYVAAEWIKRLPCAQGMEVRYVTRHVTGVVKAPRGGTELCDVIDPHIDVGTHFNHCRFFSLSVSLICQHRIVTSQVKSSSLRSVRNLTMKRLM